MRTKLSIALALMAAPALAQTTQPEPAVFRVASGVEFRIDNIATSEFVFRWSDASGSFEFGDPTLILTAGQTYVFRRTSGLHPLVITDDTLEVEGVDGMLERVTVDGAVIDAATLKPIDAFTADPAPTDDAIEWTPGPADVGEYYYTCRIAPHRTMTGAIRVEAAPPCRADLDGDGALTLFDFLAFQNLFDAGDPAADFDGDGDLTIFDFLAFQNEFDAGCS